MFLEWTVYVDQSLSAKAQTLMRFRSCIHFKVELFMVTYHFTTWPLIGLFKIDSVELGVLCRTDNYLSGGKVDQRTRKKN